MAGWFIAALCRAAVSLTLPQNHYGDVIMSAIASQITNLTIVCSTVYSGADQRKHQSSASLAFVRGIHRWPVNSPHKWPVTWKICPFDNVIMILSALAEWGQHEAEKLFTLLVPLGGSACDWWILRTKDQWFKSRLTEGRLVYLRNQCFKHYKSFVNRYRFHHTEHVSKQIIGRGN